LRKLRCAALHKFDLTIVHVFTQPLDGAAIRQLIVSGLAGKTKPAPGELSLCKSCYKAFDTLASTYNTSNL
jgi:hypothetical protein